MPWSQRFADRVVDALRCAQQHDTPSMTGFHRRVVDLVEDERLARERAAVEPASERTVVLRVAIPAVTRVTVLPRAAATVSV